MDSSVRENIGRVASLYWPFSAGGTRPRPAAKAGYNGAPRRRLVAVLFEGYRT